jgi:hypothetical protein
MEEGAARPPASAALTGNVAARRHGRAPNPPRARAATARACGATTRAKAGWCTLGTSRVRLAPPPPGPFRVSPGGAIASSARPAAARARSAQLQAGRSWSAPDNRVGGGVPHRHPPCPPPPGGHAAPHPVRRPCCARAAAAARLPLRCAALLAAAIWPAPPPRRRPATTCTAGCSAARTAGGGGRGGQGQVSPERRAAQIRATTQRPQPAPHGRPRAASASRAGLWHPWGPPGTRGAARGRRGARGGGPGVARSQAAPCPRLRPARRPLPAGPRVERVRGWREPRSAVRWPQPARNKALEHPRRSLPPQAPTTCKVGSLRRAGGLLDHHHTRAR